MNMFMWQFFMSNTHIFYANQYSEVFFNCDSIHSKWKELHGSALGDVPYPVSVSPASTAFCSLCCVSRYTEAAVCRVGGPRGLITDDLGSAGWLWPPWPLQHQDRIQPHCVTAFRRWVCTLGLHVLYMSNTVCDTILYLSLKLWQ